MRISLGRSALVAGAAMSCAFTCWASTPADSANAITLAQNQITAYLAQLADLHCTETVTQQKLGPNGHVLASEHDKFDYLIMMAGNADGFQLNESRVEEPGSRHKLPAASMLITNGVATVLLVFHPYYRDGFEFKTLPEESLDGKPAIPIHFTHIPGRRTPAALALRGREYPLDLEGTAWLDEASKQVVKVEADLSRDMSDIGLKSLKIHVEYKPEALPGNDVRMNLPTVAVVDVTTPKQHWRNTHTFDNYKGFSTDVEQNPDVKIHSDTSSGDSNKAPASSAQGAANTP